MIYFYHNFSTVVHWIFRPVWIHLANTYPDPYYFPPGTIASLAALAILILTTKREETGLRTIYRDLEALQAAGFPLFTERVERSNRWAFIDTFKFKIPSPFTLTKLMSLYVYRDLIRFLNGTPFYGSLESVFKKVQSTLPPQAISYLEQIQSVFHVGIKPYKEYGKFREILNQVSQAALDRRRIEIIYHPLQRKENTVRKVDSYKVWFCESFGKNFYWH